MYASVTHNKKIVGQCNLQSTLRRPKQLKGDRGRSSGARESPDAKLNVFLVTACIIAVRVQHHRFRTHADATPRVEWDSMRQVNVSAQ